MTLTSDKKCQRIRRGLLACSLSSVIVVSLVIYTVMALR